MTFLILPLFIAQISAADSQFDEAQAKVKQLVQCHTSHSLTIATVGIFSLLTTEAAMRRSFLTQRAGLLKIRNSNVPVSGYRTERISDIYQRIEQELLKVDAELRATPNDKGLQNLQSELVEAELRYVRLSQAVSTTGSKIALKFEGTPEQFRQEVASRKLSISLDQKYSEILLESFNRVKSRAHIFHFGIPAVMIAALLIDDYNHDQNFFGGRNLFDKNLKDLSEIELADLLVEKAESLGGWDPLNQALEDVLNGAGCAS